MNYWRFFAAIVAAILFAAAGLVLAHPAPRRISNRPHVADFAHRSQLPDVMLWAWERPEDLSGIDSSRAGVAFLARTVFLVGDTVSVRPRLQPLRLPLGGASGTALVAVVRVEVGRAMESRVAAQNKCPHRTSGTGTPAYPEERRDCAPLFTPSSLSQKQLTEAAHAVAAAAQLPGIRRTANRFRRNRIPEKLLSRVAVTSPRRNSPRRFRSPSQRSRRGALAITG